MWVMVWRRLWRGGSRTLVLGFAILVAATGFTVLTGASNAERLDTVGTVAEASQKTYDVLVRPPGTRSDLEEQEGLIEPGFLTGIYGGITLRQWHEIQDVPGVEVAAPIAMLGYAYPALQIPVDATAAWSPRGTSVARVDVTWAGDNGLTVTRESPQFTVITDHALRPNTGAGLGEGPWLFKDGTGKSRAICPVEPSDEVSPEKRPANLLCFSRTKGGMGHGHVGEEFARDGVRGAMVDFPFSYVIAAVDPASEDALVGLDGAVTSGDPLTGASVKYPDSVDGKGVPVLVSDEPGVDETATITLSGLPDSAGRAVLAGAGTGDLVKLPASLVTTQVVDAAAAQAQLMEAFRTTKPIDGQRRPTRFLPGEITQLGQVGMPRLAVTSERLEVELRKQPPGFDLAARAPASGEPAAREVTNSAKEPAVAGTPASPATLRLQGTFDPAELSHITDLTDEVLAGYSAAPTEGADRASTNALGNRPLAPSTDLGGLVQPPPTMVTTLEAIPQLTRGWSGAAASAPISAVRVRVADASVADEVSRERIRIVAQRIKDATGLDVDITTGSSAGAQGLLLPAGDHGRPQLALQQWWVTKGVATRILTAVDKKSLALFALVLLVSALSIANAAVAAVRARRTELGVLASLGWSKAQLFRAVGYELLVVACVAGLASAVLSWVLGRALGSAVDLPRAALALPIAIGVAVVAGAVPATVAARADPIEAVRPAVSEARRPHHAARVIGLAWLNLGLSRTRSALARIGLMIAVATATLLAAIVLGFQGAIVGTVLGETVSIQTRTVDIVATIATLLLGCLGVANVMYLNIRDRGTELATLRGIGWAEGQLRYLITAEGAMLGVLGATLGGLIGLGVTAVVAGDLTSIVIGWAVAVWAVSSLLAALSALAATAMVTHIPTAELLTEDA